MSLANVWNSNVVNDGDSKSIKYELLEEVKKEHVPAALCWAVVERFLGKPELIIDKNTQQRVWQRLQHSLHVTCFLFIILVGFWCRSLCAEVWGCHCCPAGVGGVERLCCDNCGAVTRGQEKLILKKKAPEQNPGRPVKMSSVPRACANESRVQGGRWEQNLTCTSPGSQEHTVSRMQFLGFLLEY